MLFEMGVNVLFPIELADDEVEVFVLVGRHIFYEERPRYFAAFDERLEHAKHVGAPLRLIGAERAGSVQHTGRDQPTGTSLQAIRTRQIEDAVVALAPILEALADVSLRRAWLKAHEG